MSSSSGSVAGRTTSESSPQVIAVAAAPQAPQIEETPGTIVTGKPFAQADEEMHERAVEERIAFAEQRDVAACGQMRCDRRRARLIEMG